MLRRENLPPVLMFMWVQKFSVMLEEERGRWIGVDVMWIEMRATYGARINSFSLSTFFFLSPLNLCESFFLLYRK